MKYHALICKFLGVWQSKRDLTKWIQQKWQPQGHIQIKLGVKDLYMIIFPNMQDKEKVFKNGPYFYYNVGLFMRYWEECYNPDKEKFLATLVWVRLFGLPTDFWDPKILEGIGNTIGSFVKIAETMKKGRYTSYARICVYMNLANPIPDSVELEYHEEVWQQNLDYEHIPFRCHRCHEHGHLVKECPITMEEEEGRSKLQKRGLVYQQGFQEVKSKRRTSKEKSKEDKREKQPFPGKSNSFEILQEEGEDEDQTMENQEDKKSDNSSSSERAHIKRKASSEFTNKDKE